MLLTEMQAKDRRLDFQSFAKAPRLGCNDVHAKSIAHPTQRVRWSASPISYWWRCVHPCRQKTLHHCFTAERLAVRADRLTERTGSCRNFGRSARKSASRPPALELRTAEARAVGPNPLGRMRVRRTVHQSAAAGGRIFWVWAAPAHSKPTPIGVLPI